MHKRPATTLAALLVLAGCGSQSIEDRVKSEYPDYAKTHGIKDEARVVGRVDCDHDATSQYDGWCRITPKGFTQTTYDVPYHDDKVFWGDSGLMAAP